mmetsp:Transcript_23449/g.67382  ORF Transcript_23449/g.67382 Transcript_23449/m.67382 type:complete len:262 (-) Transcript_23449:1921-2706(-)
MGIAEDKIREKYRCAPPSLPPHVDVMARWVRIGWVTSREQLLVAVSLLLDDDDLPERVERQHRRPQGRLVHTETAHVLDVVGDLLNRSEHLEVLVLFLEEVSRVVALALALELNGAGVAKSILILPVFRSAPECFERAAVELNLSRWDHGHLSSVGLCLSLWEDFEHGRDGQRGHAPRLRGAAQTAHRRHIPCQRALDTNARQIAVGHPECAVEGRGHCRSSLVAEVVADGREAALVLAQVFALLELHTHELRQELLRRHG